MEELPDDEPDAPPSSRHDECTGEAAGELRQFADNNRDDDESSTR